jgi:D-amino-acid oxidase
VNRRTFLTTASMAAIGTAAGGCAARRAPAPGGRRQALALAPVRVSWDRHIRTTVGLRPHRPAGFVLRADTLDEKTVIHNYGHGGAGMSLAWGTGAMAADLAMHHGARRAAVVGCGVAGLTAARELQRRGFDVTIYAAALPPEVTSSMSLAGFTPVSGLVDDALRTPGWDDQFRHAAQIAYRRLQLLAGAGYGVSWVDQYAPVRDPAPQQPESDRPPLGAGLQTDREVLGPGEHPFPTPYAIRRAGLRIEPSIYLPALMRDVVLFGGRIVVRTFDAPRDLLALSEPIIVNCTGLGSLDLFGDKTMVPVKGQLVVLVPQPEVNYQTQGGVNLPSTPGIGIHMMPRADGIALGGTAQRGVWTLEPDETERQRVVESHRQLFSGMRPPV